jgi:hypothetical protein
VGYTTIRRGRDGQAISAAAVVAAAFVFAASAAADNSPASGALVFTSASLTLDRTADGNSFYSQTNTGAISGTFSGPFVTEIRLIVHSDGSDEFVGTRTCTCTVDGKIGIVVFRLVGNGIFGALVQGTFTVLSATDELEGLHGEADFVGVFGATTYSGHVVMPS